MKPTPAQRAAATRRIRKRAADWRPLARPELSGDIADHLADAARATYGRPPLSREAVAWHQLQHLADAYSRLQRHRTPANIGALRAAREGTAALLAALVDYEGMPAPTHPMALQAGDMVSDADKGLMRIAAKRGDSIVCENGETVTLATGEEITALRPADARQYREEIEARAAQERQDDSAYFDDVRRAFDAAYSTAWEAWDGKAIQAAVDQCHASFAPLEGKYGTARQLITHRAAIARTGNPPHYPKPNGRAPKGFAQHVKRETALLERLAWVRALPGYTPGLWADVDTVKDLAGRRIKVAADSLRLPSFRDWVDRVNAAGKVTARTSQIHRDSIAAFA